MSHNLDHYKYLMWCICCHFASASFKLAALLHVCVCVYVCVCVCVCAQTPPSQAPPTSYNTAASFSAYRYNNVVITINTRTTRCREIRTYPDSRLRSTTFTSIIEPEGTPPPSR